MELEHRRRAAGELQEVLDLASYTFKELRRDGEFILYRGHPANSSHKSILVVTTLTEHSPAALRSMRREYALPEKLYGRSHDIVTLLEAFERMVSSGKPQLVLISGYSGIGKSSVINELHRALVPSRGRSRRSACSRRSARFWPMRSPAS